jgi:plasmid stabilization system protein ParE
MIYELAFTPEAEETFDLLIDQLLVRWGIKTVLKFQELTSICLDKISENPFLYQVIEENTEIRKCVVHTNCSILYRIFLNKVEIICFWDNRQDSVFG